MVNEGDSMEREIQMGFRAPVSLQREVNKLASEKGIKKAELYRIAITDYVKREQSKSA